MPAYKSTLPISIQITNNKEDVVETIMKGFSTGDPNDPYGDLSPTYRIALNASFDKKIKGIDVLHFVAYHDKKPISIATCSIFKNIAYLNNVTTLKDYKGKGVAKEVLSFAIKVLKEKKCKSIIFATETGAYTESFYQKLGFKIVDYGYCFEEK